MSDATHDDAQRDADRERGLAEYRARYSTDGIPDDDKLVLIGELARERDGLREALNDVMSSCEHRYRVDRHVEATREIARAALAATGTQSRGTA